MPSSSYAPKRNEYIEQFNASHAGIARSFSVSDRSCNNPGHFTDFLLYNAINDAQSGMGTTFALVEYDEHGGPRRIKGYVTLKTSSLLQHSENAYSGKPAVEISELAVDKEFEGQGIGSALLDYALYCCASIRKLAGVMYLLVCAEPNAVGFYKHTLGLMEVGTVYEIPREMWNETCVPMYLKLPVLDSSEPCYATDEDEEDEPDDW